MLAENQALVSLKKVVVGLQKARDADFVAKQQQALAVSAAGWQQHSSSWPKTGPFNVAG